MRCFELVQNAPDSCRAKFQGAGWGLFIPMSICACFFFPHNAAAQQTPALEFNTNVYENLSGWQLLLILLRRYWYLALIFMALVTLALALVSKRLKAIGNREWEKNQLQQQLVQSEMRALRSQMNPHFIFNAINSIQHYVLTNEKELASKYLVKFSKLMRNILDLSKEELISLKDELETVKLYLEIEALRFNNAFAFNINCDPEINPTAIRLPPLLIQPFVENAIWHGLLLKEGKKELDLRVFPEGEKVVIEVDDNGIGRESAGAFDNPEFKRRSFGMAITQNRLEVLQRVHGIQISFRVVDKKDQLSRAIGTKVVLEVNPSLSHDNSHTG